MVRERSYRIRSGMVNRGIYIKHEFVKNTNMSIQNIYIRAYGPTVSGRNRATPELRTRPDTLI
jgi:hypothetical protein